MENCVIFGVNLARLLSVTVEVYTMGKNRFHKNFAYEKLLTITIQYFALSREATYLIPRFIPFKILNITLSLDR